MEDLSSNENFWKSLAVLLAYSQTLTLELKNFKLPSPIDPSAEDDEDGSSTTPKNPL